jgi:hypothetical protein
MSLYVTHNQAQRSSEVEEISSYAFASPSLCDDLWYAFELPGIKLET